MTCAARILVLIAVPTLLGADSLTGRLNAARRMAYKPARQAYVALLPEIRASGDKATLSRACLELARLHQAVWEDTAALELSKESIAAARDAKLPKEQAKAEQFLGIIAVNRGDFETAFQAFDRALGLFRQIGDDENLAAVQARLSRVHLEEGHYLEALRATQAARSTAAAHLSKAWAQEAFPQARISEAALYRQLGREEKAAEILRKLQAESTGMKPRQAAEILLELGQINRRLGDPVRAVELLGRAAEAFESSKAGDLKVAALLNLGATQAQDLNRYDAAGETFEKARKAADWIGKRREGIYARLGRGEAHYQDGLDDEAETYWRQAQWVARDAGSADGLWRALHGLGRVAERRAEIAQALRLFQQAVDILESPRARLEPPIGGPAFLPNRREAYDSMIGLLLASNDGTVDGRALDLMERSRSTANAEWLAAVQGAELRSLRSRMRMANARRLRVRVREAKQVDEELGRISAEFMRLQPELGGSPVVTIESIQSRLPSDAALVSYWMGPAQYGYVWIIDDASGRVVQGMGDEDRARIQQLIYEAARPNGQNLERMSAEVGEMLTGFSFPSRIRKLYIVPDGALASAPFELLMNDGKSMLERYEISYLPSAAAYLRPSRPRRGGFPWTTQAMVVAGPAGFVSPAPAALLPQDEGWLTHSHSHGEVLEIPKFLPGQSQLLLGAQARRSAWSDARRIPLLHVATQAVADGETPARSRLLVASENGQPGIEYVYLPQLRQMDLSHVALATLPLVANDQTRSFGDALMAAGAQAAVTPLWHVDDASAAEFMRQFYFFLGQGLSKSGALRAAKLKMLRSETAYRHPAYWAGYVLTGEGFDPVPKVRTWSAMLLVAAGLILASGFAVSLFVPARPRHS